MGLGDSGLTQSLGPRPLDALIAERGSNLSLGQQQLLAIARCPALDAQAPPARRGVRCRGRGVPRSSCTPSSARRSPSARSCRCARPDAGGLRAHPHPRHRPCRSRTACTAWWDSAPGVRPRRRARRRARSPYELLQKKDGIFRGMIDAIDEPQRQRLHWHRDQVALRPPGVPVRAAACERPPPPAPRDRCRGRRLALPNQRRLPLVSRRSHLSKFCRFVDGCRASYTQQDRCAEQRELRQVTLPKTPAPCRRRRIRDPTPPSSPCSCTRACAADQSRRLFRDAKCLATPAAVSWARGRSCGAHRRRVGHASWHTAPPAGAINCANNAGAIGTAVPRRLGTTAV